MRLTVLHGFPEWIYGHGVTCSDDGDGDCGTEHGDKYRWELFLFCLVIYEWRYGFFFLTIDL